MIKLFTRRRSNREPHFDIDDNEGQSSNRYQCKNKKNRRKRNAKSITNDGGFILEVYDKMFETPFEFVQLSDGTIVEVRFSDRETDDTVKNFKRHIADAFATQLDTKKHQIKEQSSIGEHLTKYHVSEGEPEQSSLIKLAGAPISLSYSLEPQPVNIVRDISQDAIIKLGNGIYDPTQIDINAKHVQRIKQGHLTSTSK